MTDDKFNFQIWSIIDNWYKSGEDFWSKSLRLQKFTTPIKNNFIIVAADNITI